ncbi:MAG: DUF1016 family protein [Firmicutes bacterium]|nr:DUF1016 family protein [Candidatus Fiminaster equi]
MSKIFKYNNDIKAIKNAILISQYQSILSINERQLYLNFSVGKFISDNTRKGFWGTDALSIISEQLQKELPGLRGFKISNMKNMRQFYEEWSQYLNLKRISLESENSPDASVEITIKNCNFNVDDNFIRKFLSISFSNHCLIIRMVKTIEERTYYINRSAMDHLSYRQLGKLIESDDFHHRGKIINNFELTIKDGATASKALEAFTDQILLPAVVIEELNCRDISDVDEKVLENAIVHNIKNFILTMGKGFSFISNQFRIDAFGEDEFIDLLFFNRDLNCLVAIELKTGKFNSKYLGQLSGYLSLLNKFEKRQHENPAIGLVLCKEANKTVVDLLIQDYKNPMGVSTYKITEEVPEKLRNALPDINDLRQLLESPDITKI